METYITLLFVRRALVRSKRLGTRVPSVTCRTKRSCSNIMSHMMTVNWLWKVRPRTDTYMNWGEGRGGEGRGGEGRGGEGRGGEGRGGEGRGGEGRGGEGRGGEVAESKELDKMH